MRDEKRAREILAAWVTKNPDVPPTPPRAQIELVERFAAALADERARALRDAAAWFLLDEFEGGPPYHAGPERTPVYESSRWAAVCLIERAEGNL